MTETPIDAATVQRCIEALKGSGEYRRDWKGKRCTVGYSGELVETWTFTTHPMDILAALLPPPEKSEAEKLVAEWLDTSDVNDSYRELAQFILDKQKAHLKELIAPSDMPVVEKPQYVFGPWIEWQGGECPVPGEWVVQVETDNNWTDFDSEGDRFTDFSCADDSSNDQAKNYMWNHCDCIDITHYRVRFEVGKWYDWNGGPCPVEPDTKIDLGFASGHENLGTMFGADTWVWEHLNPRCDWDITRFRIRQTGEAQ